MKAKWVKYYMDMARLTATLSTAKRLQVGTVIVQENRVIGTGYNGTPSGWDNNCEVVELMPLNGHAADYPLFGKFWADNKQYDTNYRLVTKSEVIHSESNAILKVAASHDSTLGATMFCTHAPCIHCAKLIYQSGIKKLYWQLPYRSVEGIEFLKKSGVELEQYN